MNKLVVLLILALGLAGCNTLDGLGKDLNKAGEQIGKVFKSK